MILSIALNPAVDYVSVVIFRQRATLRPGLSLTWPGGSGVHAAVVARALGAQVKVLTFTAGHNGSLLADLISQHELALRSVTLPGETRITFSLLDERNGNICDVAERGPETPDAAVLSMRRAIKEELAAATTVILSGSLPDGCPPDILSEAISEATRQGIRVIVDLAAPELHHAVAAGPWLIKPSLEELTPPGGAEPDATHLLARCREWHEAGVQNACVSLGSRGLLWSAPKRMRHVAFGGHEPAYNAIGCGDTLVGAVAAAVDRGEPLRNALVMGVAAATANLAHVEPGFCESSEVLLFAAQTSMRELDVAELEQVLRASPHLVSLPQTSNLEAHLA